MFCWLVQALLIQTQQMSDEAVTVLLFLQLQQNLLEAGPVCLNPSCVPSPCRPVHHDCSLHLHGSVSHRRNRRRVRALLHPGMDLLCPHVLPNNHLPRPAEEDRVKTRRLKAVIRQLLFLGSCKFFILTSSFVVWNTTCSSVC